MAENRKVLVVDDELHIRKLITLIAKQVDSFEIIEATNGAEAVEMYTQHRPDMVLMDVNMPMMDGIEALRRMNEIDPAALVVMLTSLANRQTVEEALHGGAVHYLRKDTPKDEIIAELRKIVKTYLDEEGPADAQQ
ncbi:response regulator transcription factor [Nibricoccus sp. IMCC34717]|uniref:response regulator transcription factor n=1 Tax=Nibricoccus sp. IMCC34717 TaxID=3034021 RepID=UPI00384B7723